MIVLLGDSLIARGNWNKYFSTSNVKNFGIDGDTTKGVLARLSHVLNMKPEKVVLLIGINDFASLDLIDNIFKDYLKILNKLNQNKIEVIIVKLLYTQMKSYNKKVEVFNKLLDEYIRKHSYSFIDMNTELSIDNYLKDEYTYDGIHLNEKAYILFSSKLEEFIL